VAAIRKALTVENRLAELRAQHQLSQACPRPDPTVIVAGARTPMGRMSGSLKGFSGSDLGGFAIKGALEKAGVKPQDVDYVIMGQVLYAGEGQIPARQAAVKAGIPMTSRR
jgi:acetyl-CoA C-acetyltransferase